MIKVLMVGNDKTVKGGITTVINQFRNFEWRKNNINFKFIPTYIDKCNVFKVLFFCVAYARVFFYCLIANPNIMHIHMSYKGSFTRAYFLQKLAIKFHIKVVVHLHGSEFKKWYDSCSNKKQEKIKCFIKDSNYFIVLGDKWHEIIKKIEPEANIIILNNSVKIPNKKTFYKEKKTLLFLGVLIKRKGVHDLIDALHNINEDNYELLIAGVGDEENNLKKMVNDYDLNDKVKFLGWVDSKEEILSSVQFMILPSYNEGLPMSILEAMSYGVPVVSTNVGDIPTVIDDKENGFLYEPGNVNELKKILDLIFTLKQGKWELISSNALNKIKKFYSEKLYFDKVISIYSE